MAKTKSAYFCQNCGAQSAKWIGRCPSCGEWNTYVEEIISKPSDNNIKFTKTESKPVEINNVSAEKTQRIVINNNEINRVLGGGIVPGSLILLGGEPGIGKSTLLLQIALEIKNKVLYVSGEESAEQIKIRANRISKKNNETYILSDTFLENILKQAEQLSPEIIIIDSIQTVYTERAESSQGTITQIRECANLLLKYAKQTSVPIFIIGHINKDGNIAGPKILEHIVDTVLQFEGDLNYMYRILRTKKNRFGSTSEIGIFEMQDYGLREVSNPSELLLNQNNNELSGTAIAASIEGARPFLFEIQALVSSAAYGNPQRSSTGFDLRRLNMLLAVLEKRAGFRLSTKDVFLNVAGGFKINDPSVDLSVIVSVYSSDNDIIIPKKSCFSAEVGLTGELRPVSKIEQRIKEAERLGFKKIYISSGNNNFDKTKYKIKILSFSKVNDLLNELF